MKTSTTRAAPARALPHRAHRLAPRIPHARHLDALQHYTEIRRQTRLSRRQRILLARRPRARASPHHRIRRAEGGIRALAGRTRRILPPARRPIWRPLAPQPPPAANARRRRLLRPGQVRRHLLPPPACLIRSGLRLDLCRHRRRDHRRLRPLRRRCGRLRARSRGPGSRHTRQHRHPGPFGKSPRVVRHRAGRAPLASAHRDRRRTGRADARRNRLFRHGSGGAVFAVGSITFCGSLWNPPRQPRLQRAHLLLAGECRPQIRGRKHDTRPRQIPHTRPAHSYVRRKHEDLVLALPGAATSWRHPNGSHETGPDRDCCCLRMLDRSGVGGAVQMSACGRGVRVRPGGQRQQPRPAGVQHHLDPQHRDEHLRDFDDSG